MTGATLKGKDKVQPTNKYPILRYESISGKKICCLKKRGGSSPPTPTNNYFSYNFQEFFTQVFYCRKSVRSVLKFI